MKIKFLDPHGNLTPSLQRLGYSPEVEFPLKEDVEYIVYGISVWRGVLHYLIDPTNHLVPYWLPAELFEVIDHSLPTNWYFKYLGENSSSEVLIKIGYREMIYDDAHDVNLMEREDASIKIFLARKRVIDGENQEV